MADISNSNVNDTENVEIDDTGMKYRVRVANEIYPAFVENNNYKNIITVAPENVTFKSTTKTSSIEGVEAWDLPLAKGVLNSTGIENTGNLTITISNIKYSGDHLVWNGKYNGQPGAKGALTASKALFDNLLGLPCPYVEGVCSGFEYNPLVAICESIEMKWGSNALPNITYINDTLLDAYMRFFEPENLKAYDKLLIPDTVSDYNLIGKYPTFKKYTNTTIPQPVHYPELSSLLEIAMNEKNPFGVKNKMYRASSITFKKAVASPNYTFDGTRFVATAPVFDIETISYMGMTFPANCTQAHMEASGISPLQAFFYFDKDNEKAFTIRQGEANLNVGVAPTNAVAEPNNQSLIQTVQWKNLVANLPCDELTLFNHNAFHHLSNLSIQKKWRRTPSEILKFSLPYEAEMTKAVSTAGDALVAVNYPSLKDLQFDVKIDNAGIRMKQITLPPMLKVASQSTLSFLERQHRRHNLSAQLGGYWKKDQPVRFELNSEPFSRVPYATMLFGTAKSDLTRDAITKSGANRIQLESLSFKLDANDPVMVSWSKNDIMKISKKNGLVNYGIDFIKQNLVACPHIPLSKSGNDYYIAQTMTSSENAFAELVNDNIGNIALLRWGVDIPLSMLTGSVGGLTSTLDVAGTALCDNTSSNSFFLHMVHFYEREIVIGSDGFCVPKNSLFSQNDYTHALNIWQRKVSSGRLYVNASTLRGGNIFSSAVDKISSVLPKILPMIRKGIDFYNNNKSAVNNAVSAVSNIAQGNTAEGMQQGRRALQDLIKF